MIARHGSHAAYKAHMRMIGARGGKKSTGGGFTGDSERARMLGKIGGLSRKKARDARA